MVRQTWIFSAALAFAVAVPVETFAMDGVVWQGNSGKDKGQGQGKGKGQDKDKDKDKDNGPPSARGRGNSDAKAFEKAERKDAKDDDKNDRKDGRGYDNDGWSAARLRSHDNAYRLLPVDFRRIGDSGRQNDLFVLNAAAWGVSRGMNVDQIRVNTVNNRVLLTNNRGVMLVDLTEDRARSLGAWEMRRLGDRAPKEDGPAFCRSGAGHPVWGREWCLEKGHGLGSSGNVLWSRAEVDDIRYLRPAPAKLDNRGLLDVLGDVVLGRLALQAVSMGYAEPLVGTWVAEPNAPRLLRVQSGSNDVAEMVDRNGDNRVDVLYVTQWR